LPTGHKKGGQSAPRFQRMYLSALDAYIKSIVEKALKVFRHDGVPFIQKLVISGNGIRIKHLCDALQSEFTLSLKAFNALTMDELIQQTGSELFIMNTESKILDELKDILETKPDLLVFGTEIQENIQHLKSIYTTLNTKQGLCEANISSEKTIVLKEETSQRWLNSFAGSIGIKYFV
jgi:cyclophilin family peptidyl-prolyl cis-trans isomerase